VGLFFCLPLFGQPYSQYVFYFIARQGKWRAFFAFGGAWNELKKIFLFFSKFDVVFWPSMLR